MRLRARLWPQGGLWRHADFLKLWSAETISQLGSQVSLLALPLVAIITLEVSAFEVALLGVVEFAPFILVTLPAGVWVDRLRRLPILVAGDLGRAVLLATIPLAWALDVLTIWQLYAVGSGVGVCTVFFDVAYQSYPPSLVDRQQLVEGNAKLEVSRSGARETAPERLAPQSEPLPFLIAAQAMVGFGLPLYNVTRSACARPSHPSGCRAA
jgi:MFS family permease